MRELWPNPRLSIIQLKSNFEHIWHIHFWAQKSKFQRVQGWQLVKVRSNTQHWTLHFSGTKSGPIGLIFRPQFRFLIIESKNDPGHTWSKFDFCSIFIWVKVTTPSFFNGFGRNFDWILICTLGISAHWGAIKTSKSIFCPTESPTF